MRLTIASATSNFTLSFLPTPDSTLLELSDLAYPIFNVATRLELVVLYNLQGSVTQLLHNHGLFEGSDAFNEDNIIYFRNNLPVTKSSPHTRVYFAISSIRSAQLILANHCHLQPCLDHHSVLLQVSRRNLFQNLLLYCFHDHKHVTYIHQPSWMCLSCNMVHAADLSTV